MITADMTIASVMRLDPEVAPVFMSYGMHCLYCPHASAESIADASAVHGVDVDSLVEDLNKFLAQNGKYCRRPVRGGPSTSFSTDILLLYRISTRSSTSLSPSLLAKYKSSVATV